MSSQLILSVECMMECFPVYMAIYTVCQKFRDGMITRQICIFEKTVSDKSCRIFLALCDDDLEFDLELDLYGHLKVKSSF